MLLLIKNELQYYYITMRDVVRVCVREYVHAFEIYCDSNCVSPSLLAFIIGMYVAAHVLAQCGDATAL